METNTNTPEAKQPASAGCHHTTCSPSSLTDAVAETRIVKGKPREIVDADFARELERQLCALVTACNEFGGGASISHPRYTRQLSAAKKFLENAKSAGTDASGKTL